MNFVASSEFISVGMRPREDNIDDNKENDPQLLTEQEKTRIDNPGRRRHLSLVDTNKASVRTISVTELGGWHCADGQEDIVATRRSRLGSLWDSQSKYMKTSIQWKDDLSKDEGCSVHDDDVGNISLRGCDWNDLIDELNSEENLRRPRFMTAVDSLKKVDIEVTLLRQEVNTDDLSETEDDEDEVYETPDASGKKVESENKNGKIPNDVVFINESNDMSEYSADIVKYMRKLETSFSVPVDFLESCSISKSMRSTLVDWLIQVQHHLKLGQETLYLTVSMLDLVLDKRDVDPDKLQLVGISSMLVASKMEEYYPAEIKKLLHLTEDSYSHREVLEMELVLMEVLDYQLYIPSPQVFLLRYTAASLHPSNPLFLPTCHFLIDSHLPATSHPSIPPSHLAAAAVLVSGILFCITTSLTSFFPRTVWTPTLEYYSQYTVDELLLTSISMLNMVLSSVYMGADIKYKSLSQHDRLVMKDHLKREVVLRALGILEGWASK